MKMPILQLICPACKKESKVPLAKKEFTTFQVRCPHCGTTVQLESIKGFRQLKFHRDKRRIRNEFRDGEPHSKN